MAAPTGSWRHSPPPAAGSAEEGARHVAPAEELPEARDHMGRFALALAQQSDGSLVLLATERNLLRLNRASAEEIQDHRCAILQ